MLRRKAKQKQQHEPKIRWWVQPLSHPSSHSPCSHHTKARLPFVVHVARHVVDLGHEGGAAVEQHVMDEVRVLNQWLNLR